ncbi:hypothetical protein EJ04DRAFT_535067 [Polyplosphaeria fusca]|uniref:Uncharacterized protein n=1 Tax=Polyplosphaeria fusca TaxID=682080 RepID=A0A9P4R063_9PLEO|nr:hypothetical protein EJ04DRAFT_535067 [Polyplosphaeria fusca]
MATSQYCRRLSRSSSSQRTSRIEKPKSNHNSPRTLERRKTMSGTKRYTTLDDHYNMMFGIKSEDESPIPHESSRPMSWHPTPSKFHVPSRSSFVAGQTSPQDENRRHPLSSRNSGNGSDFYSLSARSSMHPEQMQNLNAAHEGNRGSQSSDGSWQSQQPPYSMSAFSTPSTEPMPWYLSEWARKNHNDIATSQHGSTDFLPIQHPALDNDVDGDEEMADSGRELVGMGLYDLPESSLGWSAMESTGKGLKLEETWQPPEDEEEEDASSDDGSEAEPQPLPEKAPKSPIAPVDLVKPQNMEGQSFFFDEDENYTKEWWFQQLRQPSIPVRDAGIGYDWL